MGTLVLPSLTEKKFITIDNISIEETSQFMDWFDVKVSENRKIKDNGPGQFLSMNLYYNIVDLQTALLSAEEIIEALKISNIAGKRGARAVFLDFETSVIGVGTTVVYNRNWAMFGVDDDSIVQTLEDLDNDCDW